MTITIFNFCSAFSSTELNALCNHGSFKENRSPFKKQVEWSSVQNFLFFLLRVFFSIFAQVRVLQKCMVQQFRVRVLSFELESRGRQQSCFFSGDRNDLYLGSKRICACKEPNLPGTLLSTTQLGHIQTSRSACSCEGRTAFVLKQASSHKFWPCKEIFWFFHTSPHNAISFAARPFTSWWTGRRWISQQ